MLKYIILHNVSPRHSQAEQTIVTSAVHLIESRRHGPSGASCGTCPHTYTHTFTHTLLDMALVELEVGN